MTDESSNRDLWLTQIKQDVHDKVGDNKWSEDSWTEFVKDVAWWLHTKKRQNDRFMIDAAAGLIKYGIMEEAQLIDVVGSPPNNRDFRESLEGKGVPPIVCDMLFNKYFPPPPPQQQQQDGKLRCCCLFSCSLCWSNIDSSLIRILVF